MKRSFIMAPMVVLLIVVLSACASSPAPAATSTTAPAAPANATSAAGPTSPAGAPTAAKPAASPAAQAQAPKYGGTINLSLPSDVVYWDDPIEGGCCSNASTVGESLWEGDWAKGPAGGFGTKATDWATQGYDLFDNKAGWIAQSWKVNVDQASQTVTIVWEVRPDVHWAVNPASDASKQVNGRTVTPEDVIASLKHDTSDPKGYIYRGYPTLRNKVDPVKTGPMEVTVKVPISEFAKAMSGLNNKIRIYPQEIRKLDETKWQNIVGSGAWMVTDYVAGSTLTKSRNPNYWMKDPVGPGKGNQLPYADKVQFFIIPDPSTRLTALRTGKIDQLEGISWEDAAQVQKEFPQMSNTEGGYSNITPAFMRTDKAPYSDVRVRQALTMATDFNTIKQTLNNGKGIIITYPWESYPGYQTLSVQPSDPDVTPGIKNLYTYNPEGAKKLLADAGFPNGLKTSVMIPQSESSYYEAIASMWAKVGVQLSLNIQDPAAVSKALITESFPDMIGYGAKGPVTTFFVGSSLTGTPGFANTSAIKDKKIDDTLVQIGVEIANDTTMKTAMQTGRELEKYVIEQAYAIPRPGYRTTTFWWPWIKNYSGESGIGFFEGPNWTQFVWVDQALKKSMGH